MSNSYILTNRAFGTKVGKIGNGLKAVQTNVQETSMHCLAVWTAPDAPAEKTRPAVDQANRILHALLSDSQGKKLVRQWGQWLTSVTNLSVRTDKQTGKVSVGKAGNKKAAPELKVESLDKAGNWYEFIKESNRAPKKFDEANLVSLLERIAKGEREGCTTKAKAAAKMALAGIEAGHAAAEARRLEKAKARHKADTAKRQAPRRAPAAVTAVPMAAATK